MACPVPTSDVPADESVPDLPVRKSPSVSDSSRRVQRLMSVQENEAKQRSDDTLTRSASDHSLHQKQSEPSTSRIVTPFSGEREGSPAVPECVPAEPSSQSETSLAVLGKASALSTVSVCPVGVWKVYIQEWFPMLLTQTYFMPPVFMKRTNMQMQTACGVEVTNPISKISRTGSKRKKDPLYECDVRDDMTQEHVLHCLGKLSDKLEEVMFVLSQFRFKNYLRKMCFYDTVSTLPCPLDLESKGLHRGDFDILIIHRTYGLIVGEIKSIGANRAELDDEKFLETLGKRLKRGLRQLDKAKKVLEYLHSDRHVRPRIQAVLMFPHVQCPQLRTVLALSENATAEKDLCTVLNVPEGEDPVDYCLCADQFSHPESPWDVSENTLSQWLEWWQRCVRRERPDPAMNDDVYLDIVARFAGPASVVQAHSVTKSFTQTRTLGQAVEAVHSQLTDFVLYPAQVDILHQALDYVFLTGPPGTGKTLMLVLMAVSWLRPAENERPQHVQIVSTQRKSRAACHLIYDQVITTAESVIGEGTRERVRVHPLDIRRGLAKAVETLQQIAENTDGLLNIVADEVDVESLASFFVALTNNSAIKKLRFWAASMKKASIPTGMTEFVLQVPLRMPPCVAREVQQAGSIQKGQVYPFSQPSLTLPSHSSKMEQSRLETERHVSLCDGPPVIKLKHVDGQDGHDGVFTVNCYQCGQRLADVLKKVLHVGLKVPADLAKSEERKVTGQNSQTSTTPIRYKDVIILVWLGLEFKAPQDGQIVKGLRDAGVPVRVVLEDDDVGIAELASMSGEDAVTMTGVDNVLGLERRVVVWVGAHIAGDDYGGRLKALSRSTGQVIWIYR